MTLRECRAKIAEITNRRKQRIENHSSDWTDEHQTLEDADKKEVARLKNLESILLEEEEASRAIAQSNATATANGDGGGTAVQTPPTTVAGGPSDNDPGDGQNPRANRPGPRVDVIRRFGRLRAFGSPQTALRAGHMLAASVYGAPQLYSSLSSDTKRVVDASKKFVVENAMSGGTGSAGGFAVDEEWTNSIIDLQEQFGVARQVSRRWSMGTDTLHIPRKTGRPSYNWTGEGATITASDQTWAEVQLTTKKLTALTVFSSELAEDMLINLADNLAVDFAREFSEAEDQAFFNGDGTGTYGSITGLENALNASAVLSGSGNSWGAITLDDFESCLANITHLIGGTENAWFMSKSAFYTIVAPLLDAAGGNRHQDLAISKRPMLFGSPVYFTEVLPKATAANTIFAYYGDMSLATAFGMRRGFRVMLSEHAYFTTDQIGIRATQRLDINVYEDGANANRRPVVGLKTTA